MTKPFSQRLYNKYDASAKSEAKIFLEQQGYKNSKSQEMYKSGDLVVNKDGSNLLVEVEVKTVWKNKKRWEAQWEDIHIPYRKIESKSAIYILFNETYSCLAMLSMDKVKSGKIIVKSTKYTVNEKFLSVPYKEFCFYKKDETQWKQIAIRETL